MPLTRRHFITYFDPCYAAKGLAMIASLFRNCPSARVTVLCFDDIVCDILVQRFKGRVELLRQADVENDVPALAPLRHQRSRWEFYATHKAVVMRVMLARCEPGELLAFIDADTFFFSSPEPLFAEASAASIVVSPHRFSQDIESFAPIVGLYNAGFGMWRNDEPGQRCLEEWMAQCLESCSIAGSSSGKFMNQGYLTQWPDRYPRTLVMTHPGANLAPWNLGRHHIKYSRRSIQVDAQPLIFFHFSALRKRADGVWTMHHPYCGKEVVRPEIRKGIFSPYLVAVEAESRRLVKKHGLTGFELNHRISENEGSVEIGTVRQLGPFAWLPGKMEG